MSKCPQHLAADHPTSFAQLGSAADPGPLIDSLLQGSAIIFDPVTNAYVATRWDDLSFIYAHPEIFSSRVETIFFNRASPQWPEVERRYRDRGFLPTLTLVAEDGAAHAKQRALVYRAFTPSNVRQLRPRIVEFANLLIDKLADDATADLMADFAEILPVAVLAEQLGFPADELAKLKFYSDAAGERLDPTISPKRELELVDIIIKFQQWIYRQAIQYRETPANVMLSRLANEHLDGAPIRPEILVNMVDQIAVAGHETTSAAIGSALYLLLRDANWLALIKQDSSKIATFVEEVLRLHPPILFAFRRVLLETKVNGCLLPKGANLLLANVCANYDPAKWDAPDAIDPSRSNLRQHLTFGRGIHFCIGNLLARTEIAVAIEELLRRYPNISLDPDAPAPNWRKVFHAHRLETLPVKLNRA